ncbi:MAG: TrbC/VirB2 family protein [Candidatus Nealsonbacteria bacterium]
MKKVILGLVLTTFLVVPLIGLAQPRSAPTVNVMQLLDKIVNWLFSILLIVAVIYLILAGYFFITAQGDPEKVSKARNMVLYALIGVLVAFAARGLVLLIETISGGGGAPGA